MINIDYEGVKMNKYEQISVFKGISEKTMDEIISSSEVVSLKKNKYLYTDGQCLDYVYFILNGIVTIAKGNESGENRVIFTLKDGDMINQPIMLNNTACVECWGFEDSEILRIEFGKFEELMSQDYILCRNCIVYMEKRIRRLYRQLKNSVTSSLEKKLAAKLYRLAMEYGKEVKDDFTLIELELSVTYIAKMTGYQRESVSRALKKLVDDGIIIREDKFFSIDMKKAEKYFK